MAENFHLIPEPAEVDGATTLVPLWYPILDTNDRPENFPGNIAHAFLFRALLPKDQCSDVGGVGIDLVDLIDDLS